MGLFLDYVVGFWEGMGMGMGWRRTFGVELQDVDVAVCVCHYHVELFAVGQEVGGYDFDGVW